MNDIKSEVEEMKNEVNKIQKEEKSFELQLLEGLKNSNKRLFILWIITFVALIGVVIYCIYLHNDIGTIEGSYEQSIEDINTIDNSNISNGGN